MNISTLLKISLMLSTTISTSVYAKDVSIMFVDTFENLVTPGIMQYEKETGNKVIRQKIPATTIYDQKLALDLIGGKASDIVMADSYTLSAHIEAGYFSPLTQYVKDWPEWQSVYDNFKKSVTFHNDIYALPLDTDVRMMYYNTETFKKAGIAIPWQPKDWAEVMATAEKLKATGVQHPLLVPVGVARGEETTMQGFYMLLLGADKPENDRNRLRDWTDNKWIIDSPALRHTLKFYQDLYVTKKLTPYTDYTQSFQMTARVNAFFDGNIGIWFDGSWRKTEMFINTGIAYSDELNNKIAYARVPGRGCVGCLDYTNISGGWVFAINKKASDVSEAAKLLSYIYKEQYFSDWLVQAGKISTREDAAQSAIYLKNKYVASLTNLVKSTTLRDTFPGYLIVTQGVQQMTQDIVDGKSIDDTLKRYKDSLEFEFGADKLKTYK